MIKIFQGTHMPTLEKEINDWCEKETTIGYFKVNIISHAMCCDPYGTITISICYTLENDYED